MGRGRDGHAGVGLCSLAARRVVCDDGAQILGDSDCWGFRLSSQENSVFSGRFEVRYLASRGWSSYPSVGGVVCNHGRNFLGKQTVISGETRFARTILVCDTLAHAVEMPIRETQNSDLVLSRPKLK